MSDLMSRMRAITRDLSPAIGRCELTHLSREPIDYRRAVAQHEMYQQLLASLGLTLTRLPAEPELPDAVFIEDTAIVFDELAVITRPGAASRRAEVESIAVALQPFRSLAHITDPATLDGGDVLRVGRDVYVGLSSRSNAAGANQLRVLLEPLGYRVSTLRVSDCLHLKSAVSVVDESLLLINPRWCDPAAFEVAGIVETDPTEPFGANVLRVKDSVVMAAAFPRTAARLRTLGVVVHRVDMSELAKAEGAVTCCSLVFSAKLDDHASD
jgi:dimethylargininase